MFLFCCSVCGNLVRVVKNGGGQPVCCGKPMQKLEPNTTDAAVEKHVPVAERKNGEVYVKVGSTVHPMSEEHYIEWIAITDGNSIQWRYLFPGDKPEAVFGDQENAEIYAYCNLHGLWKVEIK